MDLNHLLLLLYQPRHLVHLPNESTQAQAHAHAHAHAQAQAASRDRLASAFVLSKLHATTHNYYPTRFGKTTKQGRRFAVPTQQWPCIRVRADIIGHARINV